MNTCDDCNANCKHIEECLGEGVKFERIRRITGYLTPTNRFNNAKYSELQDRMNETRRTEDYHT